MTYEYNDERRRTAELPITILILTSGGPAQIA
jgi:hypothetical protein